MPPNVHFHLPNNSIEIVAIAYSIIGTFNHLRAILNLEIQSFPGGFWISCDYLEEESQLREEKYDLVVLQWQTSFSSVFSDNVPTLSFLQPSS